MSRINPTPAERQFDEGRLMQVLVAPVISEKATMVAEQSNVVTFKVLKGATKPEIKAAVELLFGVQVKSVSVANQRGKTKRFGRTVGRRDHVRKAYVMLKEGQELNLSGEAA
jgi:large subunit ribosomal protein L23